MKLLLKTSKQVLQFAAISGALAVMVGAFGAHSLKGHIDTQLMQVFHTGVNYHFYHTAALLAVGLLIQFQQASNLLKLSGTLFTVGIILFSGSLYAMAISGWHWLGIITPLGGFSFIAAWGCLWFALARDFKSP